MQQQDREGPRMRGDPEAEVCRAKEGYIMRSERGFVLYRNDYVNISPD